MIGYLKLASLTVELVLKLASLACLWLVTRQSSPCPSCPWFCSSCRRRCTALSPPDSRCILWGAWWMFLSRKSRCSSSMGRDSLNLPVTRCKARLYCFADLWCCQNCLACSRLCAGQGTALTGRDGYRPPQLDLQHPHSQLNSTGCKASSAVPPREAWPWLDP